MSDEPQNTISPKTIEQVYQPMDRRTFLKGSAAAMVGMAGLMAALKPLLALERGEITIDDLLQTHYRQLTPGDLRRIMNALEAKSEKEYGVRPAMGDLKPLDGVEFGYALNLTRCIGCRKCAHACLAENNQSRDDANDIEMSYIRVLEMKKGSINLETSTAFYDPETVPQKDSTTCRCSAISVRNRPAQKSVRSRPPGRRKTGSWSWTTTGASAAAIAWRRVRMMPAGSTTKSRPLQPGQINPDQNYLSNRIRPKGVVEKCTFCLQRTRAGKYTRLSRSLSDRRAGLRQPARSRQTRSTTSSTTSASIILKEDVGTQPRFYYFFDK